ncbi:MAG: hypothetical protein ACJ76K_10330 [Solirubrobacteraceae bacterium]
MSTEIVSAGCRAIAAHVVIRSSPAAAAFMTQAASRGTRLGAPLAGGASIVHPRAGAGGDQSGEPLSLDIRIATHIITTATTRGRGGRFDVTGRDEGLQIHVWRVVALVAARLLAPAEGAGG